MKARLQDIQRLLRAVNVDPSVLDRPVCPQIVDAVDVVGMVMGIENAVDVIYLGIEALRAEVRRGVDDDIRRLGLDED